MAPKFTFKLNPSSKYCSICLSMTLTLFQCARDWKIENLAETNFAEIFGGARQILSAQCAGILWQICYLLFYKEYGIIWLVPGVTVACHGPEVFLQTTLNFIMVQWDCGSHLWTLISMVSENVKNDEKKKKKKRKEKEITSKYSCASCWPITGETFSQRFNPCSWIDSVLIKN